MALRCSVSPHVGGSWWWWFTLSSLPWRAARSVLLQDVPLNEFSPLFHIGFHDPRVGSSRCSTHQARKEAHKAPGHHPTALETMRACRNPRRGPPATPLSMVVVAVCDAVSSPPRQNLPFSTPPSIASIACCPAAPPSARRKQQ